MATTQEELDLALQEVANQMKIDRANSGGGGTVYYNSDYEPDDHNMLGWTIRPVLVSSQVAITAGTAQMTRIKIVKTGTVNNVYFGVTNIAAGMTSCRIQIYSMAGVLLATTADISTVVTSTGEKVVPLSVPLAVTAGQELMVVVHALGTTGPTIRATVVLPGINYGLTTGSPLRTGRKTGLSAAPTAVVKTEYAAFANQIPLFMLG